jgi:hypothetical protein
MCASPSSTSGVSSPEEQAVIIDISIIAIVKSYNMRKPFINTLTPFEYSLFMPSISKIGVQKYYKYRIFGKLRNQKAYLFIFFNLNKLF